MVFIYGPKILMHWSTDIQPYSLQFYLTSSLILQVFKRYHIMQISFTSLKFLNFIGNANYKYDPNNVKETVVTKFALFTEMKVCRKLQNPRKQLSVRKSLVFLNVNCYMLTSSNGITFSSMMLYIFAKLFKQNRYSKLILF